MRAERFLALRRAAIVAATAVLLTAACVPPAGPVEPVAPLTGTTATSATAASPAPPSPGPGVRATAEPGCAPGAAIELALPVTGARPATELPAGAQASLDALAAAWGQALRFDPRNVLIGGGQGTAQTVALGEVTCGAAAGSGVLFDASGQRHLFRVPQLFPAIRLLSGAVLAAVAAEAYLGPAGEVWLGITQPVLAVGGRSAISQTLRAGVFAAPDRFAVVPLLRVTADEGLAVLNAPDITSGQVGTANLPFGHIVGLDPDYDPSLVKHPDGSVWGRVLYDVMPLDNPVPVPLGGWAALVDRGQPLVQMTDSLRRMVEDMPVQEVMTPTPTPTLTPTPEKTRTPTTTRIKESPTPVPTLTFEQMVVKEVQDMQGKFLAASHVEMDFSAFLHLDAVPLVIPTDGNVGFDQEDAGLLKQWLDEAVSYSPLLKDYLQRFPVRAVINGDLLGMPKSHYSAPDFYDGRYTINRTTDGIVILRGSEIDTTPRSKGYITEALLHEIARIVNAFDRIDGKKSDRGNVRLDPTPRERLLRDEVLSRWPPESPERQAADYFFEYWISYNSQK